MFLNGQPSVTFSWRRKHRLLMHFFEFWSFREAIPELLMPTPRAAVRPSFVPYIYSRAHIRSLLRAATKNQQRHGCLMSPQTLCAVVLFLYGTGATVGESLGVTMADVSLTTGMLVIRNNRYRRSRQIPICKDLQDALRKYVTWRSRLQIQCHRLFLTNDGQALTSRLLADNFKVLRRIAGVRRRDGCLDQPTMQDLRPTFAVHRITSWIRTGSDMNRLLPALAVYMGHAGLGTTQKYLSMTPERFRRELNKLSPIRGRKHWRDDSALMSFLARL